VHRSTTPTPRRSVRVQWHGFGGGERMVVTLEQRRDRGRRNIENRGGEESEQKCEHDERRENQQLAGIEIDKRREARLLERTENHLAIEPERVRGRQDRPGG